MQNFSSSSSHNKSSIKSKQLRLNRTQIEDTHTLFWPQKVILLFDMLMITSVPLLHFWGWKIVHTHMCGTYNVLAMYTYTYVSMLYMCISIRIPLGHSFWCCLENNGVYTSILCKSRSYMYGMDVGNSGW